jgi:hypothetical protein
VKYKGWNLPLSLIESQGSRKADSSGNHQRTDLHSQQKILEKGEEIVTCYRGDKKKSNQMELIHLIPYKGYETRILKNEQEYVFQIYKNGVHVNGFTFAVSETELNDYYSLGYPPMESFIEYIRSCEEYIDMIDQ